MEREELRRRLEAWAEEERLYAERLAESAAKARSPLVRAALTAVAMDSQKHHALLIEAARLLEGPQALGEGELEASLDDIRGHVEVEAEALRLFEGLVRDPAVQQDPPALLHIEARAEGREVPPRGAPRPLPGPGEGQGPGPGGGVGRALHGAGQVPLSRWEAGGRLGSPSSRAVPLSLPSGRRPRRTWRRS